jgi:dGTPase
MHKTQVLVTQTSDHHRTRLTHTLEVAQISRTIARRLGLNEDLTEAIALSHDLGHPPFGHAGEQALDECMREHGGFEHNRHGLRIIEVLEYPYAEFPGLNLTWEVREAMAQHSGRRGSPEVAEYLGGRPLLEAQVADAADSLAYDAHDVDDALSLGLIRFEDLQEVPFWSQSVAQVKGRFGELAPEQFQPTMIRTLINCQIGDLLEQTHQRLRAERIESVEDVRNFPELLVTFGPQMRALKAGLEKFLHQRVYQHYRVQRMTHKGRRILQALFSEFRAAPELLPTRYNRRIGSAAATCCAQQAAAAPTPERVVCDYVAGMTDRYAQDEYLRLFQPYTAV